MEVQCFKFFSWQARTSEVLQAMQLQIVHFQFSPRLLMFLCSCLALSMSRQWKLYSWAPLEKARERMA